MADTDWADLHQLRLEAMGDNPTITNPKGDTSSFVDADLIYQDLSADDATGTAAKRLTDLNCKAHSGTDWRKRVPSSAGKAVADYLEHLREDLHLEIWDVGHARSADTRLNVGDVVQTVRRNHPGSATPVHHVPAYSPTPLSFGPFGPPSPTSRGTSAASLSRPAQACGTVRLAILDTGIPSNYADLVRIVEKDPDLEDLYTRGDDLRLDAGHGLFILNVVDHLVPWLSPVYMRRPTRTHSNLSLSDHLIGLDLWEVAKDARDAQCRLIVNMSFAAYTTDNRPGQALLRELAWLAKESCDVLVVAAAGNCGDDRKMFPAACDLPNVVSVGALDASGHVAPFSSRGSWVDCWTTGVGIVAGYVDGVYDHPSGYNKTFSPPDPCATWSGTSFAAPRVAAAIARKAAEMPQACLLAVWEALRKENRDHHPHWSDSSDRFYTEHGVIIDIN